MPRYKCQKETKLIKRPDCSVCPLKDICGRSKTGPEVLTLDYEFISNLPNFTFSEGSK